MSTPLHTVMAEPGLPPARTCSTLHALVLSLAVEVPLGTLAKTPPPTKILAVTTDASQQQPNDASVVEGSSPASPLG